MAANSQTKPAPAAPGSVPGGTQSDPLSGSDSLPPATPERTGRGVRPMSHECGEREPAGGAACGRDGRFRRLLEATHIIPWEADADTWRFTYVGPQAAQVLGYPVQEWYGEGFWTAHLHPDDRERAIDLCLRSAQKGADYDFE